MQQIRKKWMGRGVSKPLWQLLKPDDEKFSLPPDDPGDAFSFDDFLQSGYTTKADEPECGWTLFSTLELASNLNVTESTRIVVEGRFRPVDDYAILLLGLNGSRYFSIKHRITKTVKLGLAMDGKERMGFSSINGIVSCDGWKYIGPAHDLQVRCVAIGGDIECDWLACAEVQI